MGITQQNNYRTELENIAKYVMHIRVIEKRGPTISEIGRVVAEYTTDKTRTEQLAEFALKVSDVYKSMREKGIEIARGTYLRAVDLNMFLSALLFGAGGAGVGYFVENTGKGALIGAAIGALVRLNGARRDRNKRIEALADEATRQVGSLLTNYHSRLTQ